ncbi:TonB protein [Granulibacter bethesdensis]|nr:TonB protein [Granulibacter bethesdensis]
MSNLTARQSITASSSFRTGASSSFRTGASSSFRTGFGWALLAGLLLHLLLLAALTAPEWLPAGWLAPPSPQTPPSQAQIEMVVQDTPSVGDAARKAGGAPQPPSQQPSDQTTPAAPPPSPPPPLAMPQADMAGDVPAPPAGVQAPSPQDAPKQPQKTASAPPSATPAPSSSSSSSPSWEQTDLGSTEVRLGDPDSGTGIVTGPVIPAKPDAKFHNKPPAYPRDAALRGQHGTVDTIIHIQPDGSVGEVEIISSSGYAMLDVATLQALKKWRFHPAMQDGHPVPAIFPFSVNFVTH